MTFTSILNLSISASWLVLAVIVVRLVLKKAPKALHCALWALVAFRLLCPISIESSLSMIPSREVLPESYLYLEPREPQFREPARLEIVTNPNFDAPVEIEIPTTLDRVQHFDIAATLVWLAGVGAMGLYAAFRWLSLRLRLRMSARVRGNVWECDDISSPFILGLLRPRIYLPADLDEETRAHVLAHEKAHLSRLDHLWKPLGFALLSIHWFNPVMWLGYALLCRDIELACDEKVIKKLNKTAVRAYSQALIRCAVPQRSIALCPLAFGEVGVKDRIKAMTRYKKPSLVLIITAVAVSVLLAACFLTDPVTPETEPIDTHPQVETVRIYQAEGVPAFTAPEFRLSSNGTFHMVPSALSSYHAVGKYTLTDGELELRTEDNRCIYIFTEENGAYIYDRDRSNDIEYYYDARSADPLPDGTRFVLTDRWQFAGQELDGLITANLQKHYGSPGDPDLLSFVSYQILDFTCASGTPLKGTLEPTNRLTLYVAAVSRSFRITDGTLSEESCTALNAAMTFQFTHDSIQLAEIQDTNGNPLNNIYSPFAREIWNYRKDSITEILAERCLLLAQEQLLNPPNADEIAALLDTICSSPAQSSNPGDYIAAHPAEYARFLELGSTAVGYSFSQFADGNCMDLKGHIMALACREIIGRTEDVYEDGTYMTGQAWFNTFAAHADQKLEALGVQELRRISPWHAMALEALGII